MTAYTFYATFGSGQPGYPGYLECTVEAGDKQYAESEARRRVREATNNRWAFLYDDLAKVHEMDRVFRGRV